MNKKEWVVLLLLYIVYLMLGSIIFLELELPQERSDRQDLIDLKKGIIGAVRNLSDEDESSMEVVMFKVGGECGHDFLDLGEDEPMTWNLWNSFFFTFTVISTIGFGHMSPSTPWGRVFCIAYALVGVPFNGIVFTTLAEFFYTKIVVGYGKIRQKEYDSLLEVFLYSLKLLLPGMLVFLFLPSVLFMYIEEEWSYLDSFYYAFITLTTIGFGDLVAGKAYGDPWLWLYKITIFIWIVFGLGYLIMIITFITKALRHKKIVRMEKRLAKALKKHAGKVNNSMQKDLGRLRQVLSAMILMENKRRDEDNTMEGHINSGFTMMNDAQTSPNLSERNHIEELLDQLSEHPGPATNKIRRAHSDASLHYNKNRFPFAAMPLESVKYFFTMAETLLQEQQVSNDREADKTAHNLVETIEADSNDDTNNIDLEATGNSDSDKDSDSLEMNKKDGYENKAYIDEEGLPNKRFPKHLQQLDFKHFNIKGNGTNNDDAYKFSEILDKLECIFCNEKNSENPISTERKDSIQSRKDSTQSRKSFSDMLNYYCIHHAHLQHNNNKENSHINASQGMNIPGFPYFQRRHSIAYSRTASLSTDATNLSETPTTELDSPAIFSFPTINFQSSPSVLENVQEDQKKSESSNNNVKNSENNSEE